MAHWTVENFQIPVPVGDCSVHILLRDGQVHNAFIMDGGKDSGGKKAHGMILESLLWIDAILLSIYSSLEPKWTFDSWVVTHWDKDHYAGMMEFFKHQQVEHFGNGLSRAWSQGLHHTQRQNHQNPPPQQGHSEQHISGGIEEISTTKDDPEALARIEQEIKVFSAKKDELSKKHGHRRYFNNTLKLKCGATPPTGELDYSLLESLVLISISLSSFW